MTKRHASRHRQRLPNRRYRRLIPAVLSSVAIAAGALPGDAAASPATNLSLRPTTTGWSLVTPAGKIAYEASGARARERCLQRALQLGAVKLS